jgi:uncharacterized membrane protein YoaK (UPF0700 family)
MSETTAVALPRPLEPESLTAAAVSVRHPLVRALVVLTFTTGLVDASSYLGLGHVFAANQTGNVVLLALGISGSGNLPVVAPLVSLGSFILGAGAAGVVTKRTGDRHITLVARALAIEVSLIASASILAAAVAITPNAASGDTVIALLALAMGVRNATIRRIGGSDLTTTVLTGTLAALASGLPFTGGSGKGSVRRIAACLALFCGALTGALLLKSGLWLPLATAAGLVLATWLVYVPAIRRHAMSAAAQLPG